VKTSSDCDERIRVHRSDAGEVKADTASTPSDDEGDDSEGSSEGSGPSSPMSDAPKGPTAAQSAPEVSDVLKLGRRGGRSLQSPHDPDASYGNKGLGYSVHITETYGNDDKPEIITDFEMRDGADNDWGKSTPIVERLTGKGRAPRILLADPGYPTPEALLTADKLGIRLHAPVKRQRDDGKVVGLERFSFDEQGDVVSCPEGHSPMRHAYKREPGCDGPELHAYFDGDRCRNCELRGQCVARGRKTGQWRVRVEPRIRMRDQAVEEQRESAWWTEYSARSGVEGTMSELKRGHGLAQLRVRRRPKVLMRTTLKVTACNVKRWIRGMQTEAAV